jgi:hypothetical protein
MLKRVLGLALSLLLIQQGYAWNSKGHKLVAAIAYEHLTPQAKQQTLKYLKSAGRVYHPLNFVESATWLDTIRYRSINWYDNYHYINIPFTRDGQSLPNIPAVNVVSGIHNAEAVLTSKYTTSFDKGLALRILIHIVGDIHQPMHAVSLASHQYPEGDRGGNLYLINAQPIAKNLHEYWDNGAGYLLKSNPTLQYHLKAEARHLSKQTPCDAHALNSGPTQWAAESNAIAKNFSYKILEGNHPSGDYQTQSEQIVKQRIILAGCRLANELNKIYG